jgi:hypothetical protein
MPAGTRVDAADGREAAHAPRRLVVELNGQSAKDLRDLVSLEELNKTTIVNRALQLYALVRKLEREGGGLYLRERDSTELQRLLLL